MNNTDKEFKNVCAYKIEKCLKCNAETNNKDEKEFFCSQCGSPVLNVCSNYECQEILDSKAKYCKYCGAKSIFNNYRLLDSPQPNNDDDLPF